MNYNEEYLIFDLLYGRDKLGIQLKFLIRQNLILGFIQTMYSKLKGRKKKSVEIFNRSPISQEGQHLTPKTHNRFIESNLRYIEKNRLSCR